MAKKGKYERVEPNKKNNNSGSNKNNNNRTNSNNKNKNKQPNKNSSNKPKPNNNKPKANTQPAQPAIIEEPIVEPIVETVVQQETIVTTPVENTTASRNPMNATRFDPKSDMPVLVKDEKKPSPINKNTGKIIYQDASQLGFTNTAKPAQDKDIQIYSDQPIEESQMRPYEKRKAAIEKNSNKTNKAPKKQEVQKSTKVVKEKPKKQPASKPQKDARVLAYEDSIRQAEKEGAIAGLFVLLFMGIIVGGYYLLSLAYPAISVDALANKLIETVMMGFVDMTQRPPDLETIPIFGDFLQWLGDKWHSMVF